MLLNNDNGVFITAIFTGHIYDTVLDIYFAEARFYDAKNRQWLSSDPMKDGLNWYLYVGANPATFVDSTGLFPVDARQTVADGRELLGIEDYGWSPWILDIEQWFNDFVNSSDPLAGLVIGGFTSTAKNNPYGMAILALLALLTSNPDMVLPPSLPMPDIPDYFGRLEVCPEATARNHAREQADAARNDRGKRNKVAVIVTMNGEIAVGFNLEGIFNKEVQGILDANGRPNVFNRQCAEINAISKARNLGYDLTGAAIAVVIIGGPNSATHGMPEKPCDVCARLIAYYGMVYVG